MEKQARVFKDEVEECPVCKANAVEPCQQPKVDNCPRGDERKSR